jgi:hypothetical protein
MKDLILIGAFGFVLLMGYIVGYAHGKDSAHD